MKRHLLVFYYIYTVSALSPVPMPDFQRISFFPSLLYGKGRSYKRRSGGRSGCRLSAKRIFAAISGYPGSENIKTHQVCGRDPRTFRAGAYGRSCKRDAAERCGGFFHVSDFHGRTVCRSRCRHADAAEIHMV